MKARILYAPVVKPDLPQCESMRMNSYFNDRPDTDKQCKHSARYEIGGKHYCQKHAGMVALDFLLRQGMQDETQPN